MSSSNLCQALQSCLEPLVIEPRVLSLKLAPKGSPPSIEQEKALMKNNNECLKNDTKCDWSFLEALTKSDNVNEKVYVHPTVKRSSSMLSEKSLEMCTESLGSETGSNAGDSSEDVSFFSFETRNDANNMNNCVSSRRVNKVSNFPPPLTSITDFGGVHVRPYREGGRLILEAVASPSHTPYFHAERGDGRLRLSIFAYDGDDDYEGEEEEEEEEEEKEDDEKEGESEKENEVCDDEVNEKECVEKVEDEMGVTKFGRPRRCKESGNRDFFGDGYFEIPSISLCL
ncbi:protein FANTASTIC FOUR 2 [Cicer arietinum]|uniref:Protein FANTASTIC FOUR 1 n=1 Tax=Cicer arietinum TaxID=3827 RepID=A0A1S3E0L8_CICAR|nr:protein FANTASTIC FOUR 1 [Cicer arietinum]